MKRLQRALALPHVVGACIATIAVWTIASTVLVIWTQRFYHSTLDAAAVVARENVGNADAAQVRTRLPGLAERFAVWRITVAAFDRSGRFVAGDSRLSSNGAPTGNEPAPAVGRQVAVVPTHDGYLLLIPEPEAVKSVRRDIVGWLMLTLIIVAAAAYGFGWIWARERARSIARLRDALRDVAVGSSTTLTTQADPLYGELWDAAAAAVTRLGQEVSTLAEGEERLRAFLADAGHELRTPLAIAVGYAGILKRGGAHDAALTERIVADISVEHDRLARLVERILQLARLDALAMDPNAVSNVTEVAQEAIALAQTLAPQREIALHAPADAYAAIAADDLRDALRNVLDNALRYAPDAAVSVKVLADGDITIRVSDRGPGMDAFTASHAFDRFFRGPDRGSVSGSGLGLAIVRRIVERAAGSVDLRSVPGEGTSVELHVPRARTLT